MVIPEHLPLSVSVLSCSASTIICTSPLCLISTRVKRFLLSSTPLTFSPTVTCNVIIYQSLVPGQFSNHCNVCRWIQDTITFVSIDLPGPFSSHTHSYDSGAAVTARARQRSAHRHRQPQPTIYPVGGGCAGQSISDVRNNLKCSEAGKLGYCHFGSKN
jgi:hypothetical protein